MPVAEHPSQPVRGQRTICIPCSQEQYERIVDDPAQFRAYLNATKLTRNIRTPNGLLHLEHGRGSGPPVGLVTTPHRCPREPPPCRLGSSPSSTGCVKTSPPTWPARSSKRPAAGPITPGGDASSTRP